MSGSRAGDPADGAAKAELHVHLEGTIGPALARSLAARNGVALDGALLSGGERYRWAGFQGFLRCYDAVAATVASGRDYAEVTRAYLVGLAADGCVYAELTVSPGHAERAGVGWREHFDGVAAGVAAAREATDIEARLIVTALRHEPPEEAEALVRRLEREPRPLVTGFGLAGNETARPAGDFLGAFERARSLGLGLTVHAGELAGPESVRDALRLPVTRIGHGVRAVEDAAVVAELAERGIVLEVCPSSNVALGVAPSWEAHPLRPLHDAGVRVTLGSDDPPHFGTTLGDEYRRARDRLGFGPDELRAMTRTALEAAFVDEPTRAALLARAGA